MNEIIRLAEPYVPLIYVFLSGLGFSIQNLVVKILSLNGLNASFSCVLSRGICQVVICSYLVYIDEDRRAGKGPKLFGDTPFVQGMMFLRSFLGFGGIGFGLLSTEFLPMGDSATLTMMSPIFAAMLGVIILHEAWRVPEMIGSLLAMAGAVLVSKPSFVFGGNSTDPFGVLMALLAAVSASTAFICIRILGTTAKMPYSNVCVSQGIAQIIMAFPAAYLAHQRWRFDIGYYNFFLIAIGGLVGVFSQILMTIGMQREKSALASAMRMSDIFFSYIFQLMFTGESLSSLSVLGTSLVMMSVLVIVFSKKSDLKSPGDSGEDGGNKEDIEDADIDDECEIELYDLSAATSFSTNDSHDSTNGQRDMYKSHSSAMLQGWSRTIRSQIQSIFKQPIDYKIIDQESRHGNDML